MEPWFVPHSYCPNGLLTCNPCLVLSDFALSMDVSVYKPPVYSCASHSLQCQVVLCIFFSFYLLINPLVRQTIRNPFTSRSVNTIVNESVLCGPPQVYP